LASHVFPQVAVKHAKEQGRVCVYLLLILCVHSATTTVGVLYAWRVCVVCLTDGDLTLTNS